MSGYIGAGSTSHLVNKMYVGISGQAKAVQKAYIGVAGKAKLWYQLGTPAGELAIGAIVKDIYGDEEFIVIHKGNPNTSIYDSSCDGVWLMPKNCVASLRFNSVRKRDITNSEAMNWLNSTFYNALAIKNFVKTVKIPYYGTGNSPSLYTGANGYSTKIFLLSAVEAGFTNRYPSVFVDDGAKLAYFDQTNDSNYKRAVTLNGNGVEWWMRTPRRDISYYQEDQAVKPNTSGGYGRGWVNEYHGIRPAFIVPYDTKLKI